jgi:hypothetical protein
MSVLELLGVYRPLKYYYSISLALFYLLYSNYIVSPLRKNLFSKEHPSPLCLALQYITAVPEQTTHSNMSLAPTLLFVPPPLPPFSKGVH